MSSESLKKKKKNADEPKRKYNDAEYFVLSMHPLPPVVWGNSQAGQ